MEDAFLIWFYLGDFIPPKGYERVTDLTKNIDEMLISETIIHIVHSMGDSFGDNPIMECRYDFPYVER